ncbi:MAG: glutathione S-transferase N-terminal domain-containing protein [Myxococcota bacterium]|nr:glutathione S-transferase N-terminal domain-containing protein [Myxococcota bacterium]
MNPLSVGSSLAASAARLASGMQVGTLGKRPAERLEIYEFEGCPFCRKVREAATVLDLELLVRPCPKGGPRYREELIQRGGKAQFPYLVDPNTGKEMYESDAIVAYLFAEYGDGKVPWTLRPGFLTDATAAVATAVRGGAGSFYVPSRPPEQPLELWSFEASPYCRLVREALTRHELLYVLHNVGKGSPGRDAFVKRSGRMMVPYLADPNTGVEMFESADIVVYLEQTYGAGTG